VNWQPKVALGLTLAFVPAVARAQGALSSGAGTLEDELEGWLRDLDRQLQAGQ
jgi:hypothetical protein